jgi:polysaccharide biosynthesis transport protein
MTTEQTEIYAEPASILAQVPGILLQRKWWLIIPAVVLLIAGIAAAYLIPALYRSSATLLVEAADVPIDTQISGGAEIVDERLAKIRQQILSRRDLIQLMDKYTLYQNERQSDPLSKVVSKFHDAISVTPVSAEFQQSGGKATIAFTISYDYRDPILAQQVTQSLIDRIVEIDSTANVDQTRAAVAFLSQQTEDLQGQITLVQTQLSSLKAQNGSVLSNVNVPMMGGGGGADAQIAMLQRDNANLNQQRDLVKSSAERDPVVSQAEAGLAAAKAVYADNHPDVIFAKQRLEEANRLAASNVKKVPVDSIAQQIAFNNTQISALQRAKAMDMSRSSQIYSAQSRGPAVMEAAAQMQQRLDGLNNQYQQSSTRLIAAQAAARAATEQRGERLVVVDAPSQPDQPTSPNRPMLMAGGGAMGAGLGLALVLLMELMRRPIRGSSGLEAVTGLTPLGVIPIISPKNAKGGSPDDDGGRWQWLKRLNPLSWRRSKPAMADG